MRIFIWLKTNIFITTNIHCWISAVTKIIYQTKTSNITCMIAKQLRSQNFEMRWGAKQTIVITLILLISSKKLKRSTLWQFFNSFLLIICKNNRTNREGRQCLMDTPPYATVVKDTLIYTSSKNIIKRRTPRVVGYDSGET